MSTTPEATAAGLDDWTLAPKLEARLAPLANNPTLARLVEVCARLARNSRAEGSKAVYDQHWRTFCVFCDAVDLSPDLPVPGETAACFLAWLADAGRVDRTTGERTGAGEPLRHGYLRQAVAALGYRHELEGLASALHDPLVQAVLRGYGRIHGTDVDGKDPIRLADLTRIATALPRPSPMAARDRALILLATHPGYGLKAGQLARLDGEHVLVPNDPAEPVVLLVHPGGRSLGLDVIEIPPDDQIPDACAALALTELAPDAFGPVFRSTSKQRLSRQAVLKIVRSAITAAGFASRANSDGVPRLADPADRARLTGHITGPDPADIRDLALILSLYWGAFRGSELCAMRWDDARVVDQGVEWIVRRAKNDQLGRGETVGAARNPNPLLCPATALRTWQATLTRLLGREPRGDEPVFVRLDRHIDILEAITRDGASQVVKRATRAAGLVGDYASHFLRAGFVSDALDAGATREQVQRHGRWANITSIDPYYRKTQTWGPNNPSRHLADNASEPRHQCPTEPNAGSAWHAARRPACGLRRTPEPGVAVRCRKNNRPGVTRPRVNERQRDPGMRRPTRRLTPRLRRVYAGAAAALAAICSFPPAAEAAPRGCPQPVQDRYEAGEQVTIVGYTGGCLHIPAEASRSDDRPLYAYLLDDTFVHGPRESVGASSEKPNEPTDGVPLGRFTLDEPSQEQQGRRASLTFTLPADLTPGAYYVGICQDPCSTVAPGPPPPSCWASSSPSPRRCPPNLLRPGGSLHVGTQGWPSWPIYVGVDPPDRRRLARSWPLDDPAIEDLADDAYLHDADGNVITAAELRALTTSNETKGSERTKTASSSAEDDDPRNHGTQLTLWLAAALLLVTWWAASRLGPTRKQIRQKR